MPGVLHGEWDEAVVLYAKLMEAGLKLIEAGLAVDRQDTALEAVQRLKAKTNDFLFAEAVT